VTALATLVATLLRFRTRACVVLACIAAMLCTSVNASALERVQTKTRVWDFSSAAPLNTWLERSATPRTHPENPLARSEPASASPHAARGTTALARVELNIGKHAAEQMTKRGITESMVKTALEKGTPFVDPKNGTINYVLKEGFASGKDLLVGTNPLTGKITTVIRGRDLVSPRFVPYTPR